jgi:cell division protease FtsH
MGALGYVMHVPEEEKYLQTEAELHDRLVSLLGGRAAEEIVFGNVTTGAANDIEQATNIATSMSKRFGLMGLATVENEYLGGGARLTCSDRTASDVDTEIMETLKQCYEQAKELLSGNRDLMDKLAAHLIEKETISGKEFMKIYRQEKGIPEDSGENSPKENGEEDKKPAVADAAQQAVEETETGSLEDADAPAGASCPENSVSAEGTHSAGDTGSTADAGGKVPENVESSDNAQNQTKGLFSNASSDIFK